MSVPRIVVLISGRGSNMEAIARSIEAGVLRGRCRLAAVLSNRPDAPGLVVAERLGLPTCVVPSAGLSTDAYGERLLAAFEHYAPDYIVLAGFMRYLSAAVVGRYPGRILNIHPADTCAYQGPNGYGWAFRAGLATTRITVHRVDAGIDSGEVLARAEVDLRGAETLDEVVSRGLAVEHDLYPNTLAKLLAEEVV